MWWLHLRANDTFAVMATAKNPKKLHTLNVRVSDETLAELRDIAAVENRPVANLLSTLLLEALKARRERAGG